MPARIRACAARPGLAKCGEGRRGSEPKATDLADRTPRARTAPAAVTVCYTKYGRTLFFIKIIFYSFCYNIKKCHIQLYGGIIKIISIFLWSLYTHQPIRDLCFLCPPTKCFWFEFEQESLTQALALKDTALYLWILYHIQQIQPILNGLC